MMQALNSSRTAEILARYRPIAPKPPDHDLTETNKNSNSNPSEKIGESGHLRSVRPDHLQARPTGTRKRGRALLAPKRSKHTCGGFYPYFSPKNLSAFLASPNVLIPNHTVAAGTVQATVKGLDLNMHAPVEKDLLQQLQAKEVQVQSGGAVAVPMPMRLVSSAITVHPRTISNHQEVAGQSRSKAKKEIEEEVESEALPTVISDSKNKVRMANSAYNKLVGQPECCWLDSVAGCGGDGNGGKAVPCNKICGEVMLQLPDTALLEEFVSTTSNGFFAWW